MLLLVLAACTEKQPDRLALDPSGPFKLERKGQTEDVRVAAFSGAQPFVKKVPAVWKSSDTSVATVDDTGKITCTGSGAATVTVSAWGLEASAPVSASVVGSVEVKDDVPHPIKLSSKGAQLHVTVKDDKGNVIAKPPTVRYTPSDYCVEASDDGFLKPLSDGDCDVTVAVADKSAKIKLQVRE